MQFFPNISHCRHDCCAVRMPLYYLSVQFRTKFERVFHNVAHCLSGLMCGAGTWTHSIRKWKWLSSLWTGLQTHSCEHNSRRTSCHAYAHTHVRTLSSVHVYYRRIYFIFCTKWFSQTCIQSSLSSTQSDYLTQIQFPHTSFTTSTKPTFTRRRTHFINIS